VSSPAKEKKAARPGNPPESSIVFWLRILLTFVALASLMLLAGNWLNATFSLWTRSIIVDFTQAEFDPSGVYKLQLTVPVDHKRIFPSQIRLRDADEDKFSYTPRTNSLFSNCQGLFTIQGKSSLLIAWPASPTALPTKGEGVLMFPVLFPSWIIGVASFLLTSTSAALFCCLPFPTCKIKVLAQRSVDLASWSLLMLGRHPLIVLSLPSAYLLLVYPPLWKDVDALCQLILPADVTNIYHFPALFCFSARLIVWLGDLFFTWRSPDLLALQRPTLQGIYTLVLVQHLALVLSLGVLCKTLTRRDRLRGVFVIGFFFASSLYTSLLLCGSEAWSVCATILLFAFGLRLYSAQGSETINWIGYCFSLVFAIGSRHINLLLGFWLIGLYLAVGIIRLCLRRERGLPSRPFVKAGVALILLFVAVFSNNFLELYLATRVGVEPRTTLGRTLSDRIDSFLTRIRPAERTKLAQELTETTSDRNVRAAIQDQATIGSFYKGTNAILEEQLRAEGFSGEHLQAEKDRVILKATLIYLKTLHPVLVRVIWKDFLRGFTETSNFSLATDPFAENSYVGKYRLDNPEIWIPLDVLSSTFLPGAAAWFDRSLNDVYLKGRTVKGFGRLHLSSTLFLTVLFVGLCFWNRRAMYSRAIPALTILVTGIGVFAATMICVFFMTRYALPLWVSVLIALGLAIDGLFEGRSQKGTERFEHKEAKKAKGMRM
jgi:hypothetical protein